MCVKRTVEEKAILTQSIVETIKCSKTKDCQTKAEEGPADVSTNKLDNVVAAGITFPEAIFKEEVHTSETFIADFRKSVTAPLGLDPSACVVLDVYKGSVIIDYALIGVESTKETEEFLETNEDFASAVASELSSKMVENNVTALGNALPVTCKTVEQEISPSSSAPIVIILIILVLAAGVASFAIRNYMQRTTLAKVIMEQVSERKSELHDIEEEKTRKKEHYEKMMALHMRASESELDAIRKIFDGMERNVREIFFEDLTLSKVLGSGAFGSVHLAIWKNDLLHGNNTGITVAAKVMNRQHLRANVLVNVRGEILLLAALKPHPNIIQFIGATWNSPPNVAILMEYADGGDLFSLLHKQDKIRLSWSENMLTIARGVARGIAHMHAHTYIHRDIKPGNILLTHSLTPKIGDLGEARIVEDGKKMTQVGTPLYCAPEILDDDFYDEKVDIYSLAVTLNQMDTRETPYTDPTTRESTFNALKVVGGSLRPPLYEQSTSGIKVSDSCPGLRSLIAQCWDPSPALRPSAEEVIDALEDIERTLGIERDKASQNETRLPGAVS